MAALLLVTAPVFAQEPAEQYRQATADIERLREEGKLLEARQRVQSTLSIPREGIPPEVKSRLVLAQDAVVVAAAAAYVRGDDCGFLTKDELSKDPAFAGRPLADVGIHLFATMVPRLDRLESEEVRAAYLEEPRFAPLRAIPLARCVFASTWRRPQLEVWPDLRVDTFDPRFDALFDYTALQARRRPDEETLGAQWMRAEEQRRRGPGDAWTFAWQCALLAPKEKGGLPSGLASLKNAEWVAAATAQVDERARGAPWGFDALCLLNLTIAAGDFDRARSLLARLRRHGGFLYDQGIDKALTFMRTLDPAEPAVRELQALLLAHGVGAPPAPAAPDDAFGPLRAGVAELVRLREAGEHAEMRARFDANKALRDRTPLPPDLSTDLVAAELAAVTAAGMAYGRGEDGRWYTKEELAKPPLAGKSRRELALSLLQPVIQGLIAGVPVAELRHRILDDPALASLRETPALRVETWVWGQPPRVVWPGITVVTGDAEFDRLFRGTAMLSPQPGALLAPVDDWIRGQTPQHRTPADVWTFRWRCALLAPYGEGGWPTRLSLLQDPRAVADALRALEARGGAEPAGFDALCRVNLHIAAGDHDRARALIETLRKEGGFFYDLAVMKGLVMTFNVSRGAEPAPALRALIDQLTESSCGLPPAPGR